MATVTAQLGEGTVVDIQARQFSWLVLWVVIAVAYSPQTAEDAEVFGQDRQDIVM